jgi:glycosyltransferase involved in cell wall biosynthesis
MNLNAQVATSMTGRPRDGEVAVYWLGPTNGTSGYAEEGRALIAALRSCGVRTIASDIAQPESAADINRIARALQDADFGYREGDWVIHHRAWACRPQGGGRHIWRTMFETDSIPSAWLDASAYYEQIWVPSVFNARTFAAAGVPSDKIRVVNCPIPSTWPELDTLPRPRKGGAKPYRFFSVMRWQQRKGWDALVRAFAQEFAEDPTVELLIHAIPFHSDDAGHIDREYGGLLAELGIEALPNVAIAIGKVSRSALINRYVQSDAFVLPSRGEGWGRPYMEAMLTGLPTIGSKWSGNLTFMDNSNSFLVDGEVKPVSSHAVQEWPYFRGHNWFEPSIAGLRQTMRSLVNGEGHLTESLPEIAVRLRRKFSPRVIAEQMTRQLT